MRNCVTVHMGSEFWLSLHMIDTTCLRDIMKENWDFFFRIKTADFRCSFSDFRKDG
jgi:hypothetical protein